MKNFKVLLIVVVAIAISATLTKTILTSPYINSSTVAVTANSTDLNKLSGLATTKTELGYLSGTTSNIQTQLNTKVSIDSLQSATDEFYNKNQSNARFINEDGDTITGTILVPTPAAGTNTTQVVNAEFVTLADTKNSTDRAFELMGSTIKALPVGITPGGSSVTYTFVDNTLYGCIFNIEFPKTLTGVKFKLQTQGSYTADNANSIALFSLSNGTCTQVAITSDDGNIWKGAANSTQTFAFTSPYLANPGLYVVCGLYNNSAQTTAPKIYCGNGWGINIINTFAAMNSNAEKLYFTLAGQNTMPSSFLMSSASSADFPAIFIIY